MKKSKVKSTSQGKWVLPKKKPKRPGVMVRIDPGLVKRLKKNYPLLRSVSQMVHMAIMETGVEW